MVSRATSLAKDSGIAISNELDSKFDVIREVAQYLDTLEELSNVDIEQLTLDIAEAVNFEGITVVTVPSTSPASWDSVNKILYVPTVKGDIGGTITVTSIVTNSDYSITLNFSDGSSFSTSTLRGEQGPQGLQGLTGATGPQGLQGVQGPQGIQGDKIRVTSTVVNPDGTLTLGFDDGTTFTTTGSLTGPVGDSLTMISAVTNNDYTYTFNFSDGTSFTTEVLKGATGDSVDHVSPTSTTDPGGVYGNPGESDTYTLFADVAESVALGSFLVSNGFGGDMDKATYDTNSSGIVDNAESLNGKTITTIEAERTSEIAAALVPYQQSATAINTTNVDASVVAVPTISDMITKVDGIESGATADQTAVEIKTLYESNAVTSVDTASNFSTTKTVELTGDVVGSVTTDFSGVSSIPTTVPELVNKVSISGDGTNALRLSYPEGGVFRGQPEDVGAIKVTFPVGFTYKMLTIKLTMYDYALGESFEVVVSGYAYSTDGSWLECTAYIVGDPGKDRVFYVRYGNSGGKPCVYIGEINSTWSHLSVTVTDVILGFTTANYLEWSQGWDISLESVAFESITVILPADQIGRTIGRNLILHEGMGSGFIYPTLLNGNVDVIADQRAYYTKSAAGLVNVAFNITGGLAGLLFTLPVGFRPPVDLLYINNTLGTYFRKSGAVEITSGTTAATSGYKSDTTFMAGA